MPDEKKEKKEEQGITLTEVRDAVRGELDTVREGLEGQFAKKEEIQSELKAIQGELDKLAARGEKPDADEVKELEKRLEEREKEQARISEKLRLLEAGVLAPAKTDDREVDFSGAFLKNADELRKVLRQGSYESRAIDASVISSAGKLNPDQANAFIDFVVAQQVTLSLITVVRMMSPQGYTEELRVAARKLRAATEGTAPSLGDSITAKRRTMTTVEVILAEDLTLTFLEDNIERRGAENHIARLLATAFGNDSNDLGWNGNDADSDAFTGINDGWFTLAAADSDVNDITSWASAIDTATEVFHEMWKSVPTKFLGRPDFVYFVPVVLAQNYAEEVSRRETGMGDQVLINGLPMLRYFGRRVVGDPHISASDAKAMLTPTANLHYGIQRSMTVDAEWQPRKRVVEYTITGRTDYEYATGEAIVYAQNVPASLLT